MNNKSLNYDEKCQLLIIGDSTVGKTSILAKYTGKAFNDTYLATVGLDFFTKDAEFNNIIIRIKIWDTAGQERYKSLTQGFFRNAQGVIIAFDVTNVETFENLKYWIQSIKTYVGEEIGLIPIIIIGNKIDKVSEREVKKEDASAFCGKNRFKYFETSAKTGEGINEAINNLVLQVLNKNSNNEDEERQSVKLGEKNGEKEESKKTRCC